MACSLNPERGRICSGYSRRQSRWLTNAGLNAAFGHMYAYGHMYAMHSDVSPESGEPDVAKPKRWSASYWTRRCFRARLSFQLSGIFGTLSLPHITLRSTHRIPGMRREWTDRNNFSHPDLNCPRKWQHRGMMCAQSAFGLVATVHIDRLSCHIRRARAGEKSDQLCDLVVATGTVHGYRLDAGIPRLRFHIVQSRRAD
jgi:hypothetical protein